MVEQKVHRFEDLLNEITKIQSGDLYKIAGSQAVEQIKKRLTEDDLQFVLGPIAWVYFNNLLTNYVIDPDTHENNLELVIANIEGHRPVKEVSAISAANMKVI